jgi:hypothetical protein
MSCKASLILFCFDLFIIEYIQQSRRQKQRIIKSSMFCPRILFAEEASRSESSALANPRAPTFYTRERIRGTVLINYIDTGEPVFDTVQILLRGMSIQLPTPTYG